MIVLAFVKISLMWIRIRPYFIILITVLLSTLILWLPFLLRWSQIGHLKLPESLNMLTIYKHWDGPLYVIVAKSWYNPLNAILQLKPLGLTANYFVAHFPLYPLLISLGAPVLGYMKSMVFWPVLFACFYAGTLFYFGKKLKLTKKPLWLAMIALFFTPRFFVVRSVGAPETIFMFFILTSMFFFLEKRYWLAGLLGALAVLVRSPGILLFVGYSLYFLQNMFKDRRCKLNYFGILLIPFGLLAVFGLYYFQYGDFFAYFKSGDNIHLLFPPFQVFNQFAKWVGTGWLEDIWLIFLFYLVTLFQLWKMEKLRPVFYFMLVYFLAIISVEHKDIARYSLPMVPFALIAFEKFFTSKKFVYALVILLPALYLYAWNFLLHNIAPISDWTIFM